MTTPGSIVSEPPLVIVVSPQIAIGLSALLHVIVPDRLPLMHAARAERS
jgi:hypothetical protein